MDLRTLSDQLPPSEYTIPAELQQSFRHAATSITQLFRDGKRASEKGTSHSGLP